MNNSVQPGGIHLATGGDGSFTSEEVYFVVDFTKPFNLLPGHYFFVPQVELTGTDGSFLWLSATRPLVPPSSVFAPDLQSWTRDGTIEPDWMRIGTDIVGAVWHHRLSMPLFRFPVPFLTLIQHYFSLAVRSRLSSC